MTLLDRIVERVGKALRLASCDECGRVWCRCRELFAAIEKQQNLIAAANERTRDSVARQRAESVVRAAAKLRGDEPASLTSRSYGPIHPIPAHRRAYLRSLPREKVKLTGNPWKKR